MLLENKSNVGKSFELVPQFDTLYLLLGCFYVQVLYMLELIFFFISVIFFVSFICFFVICFIFFVYTVLFFCFLKEAPETLCDKFIE